MGRSRKGDRFTRPSHRPQQGVKPSGGPLHQEIRVRDPQPGCDLVLGFPDDAKGRRKVVETLQLGEVQKPGFAEGFLEGRIQVTPPAMTGHVQAQRVSRVPGQERRDKRRGQDGKISPATILKVL